MIEEFLEHGKRLTLLDGKRPSLKHWRTAQVDYEKLRNYSGNLGWVLGPGDLVVDIDGEKGAASFEELTAQIDITTGGEHTVVTTPSGGKHLYLKIPEKYSAWKIKKTHENFPKIDFLSVGAQCVIPGSEGYTADRFLQAEASDQLMEMISKPIAELVVNNKDDLGDFSGLIENTTVSRKQVMSALSVLDPGCGHDEWIKIGMALHDWHPADGLKIWDKWSQDGDTYKEGETTKRWRSFTGGGIKVGTLLYMAGEVEKKDQAAGVEDAKIWTDDLCYITNEDRIYSKTLPRSWSTRGFNFEFAQNVPANKKGRRPIAFTWVQEHGLLDRAEVRMYVPTSDDPLLTIDGRRILNTFIPSSVPPASSVLDEDGLKAVGIVNRHILMICNGDEGAAEILLHWLAHNIQHPGVKLLWSPVIQSIPGIGKSFFGRLMAAVMGDDNVGTVGTSQVVSSFNGWAFGKCVNILEELRIAGHNRHEAVNALKPLITDRTIQINEKGIRTFGAINTTNYICFTNYRDALPVDKNDRRWWVVFVDVENLSDVGSEFGLSTNDYFQQLFDCLDFESAQLRRWLLDVDIPKSFTDIKAAPMTESKAAMIATDMDALIGLDQLKAVLKAGGEFISEDCFSSSHALSNVKDRLMIEGYYPELSNHEKHQLLKAAGYVKHPVNVKVNGESLKIWSKKPMSKREIRAKLKR